MLSPSLPLSLPNHFSNGDGKGDFVVVARRVVTLCTATEGGEWVISEFTDFHCVLKEGHIRLGQWFQYAHCAAGDWP